MDGVFAVLYLVFVCLLFLVYSRDCQSDLQIWVESHIYLKVLGHILLMLALLHLIFVVVYTLYSRQNKTILCRRCVFKSQQSKFKFHIYYCRFPLFSVSWALVCLMLLCKCFSLALLLFSIRLVIPGSLFSNQFWCFLFDLSSTEKTAWFTMLLILLMSLSNHFFQHYTAGYILYITIVDYHSVDHCWWWYADY